MKVMEEILEGKSKALQLLTYAFLFEKTQPNQPISAGLYRLKAYNLGYLPLQIKKNHLIDASSIDAYEKCIEQIVGNMLNPGQDLAHNEVSTYCTFC